MAQRDPAHRLRLRRRRGAGPEHHPPAGQAQLHRDYPCLSGHERRRYDGIPGLHPHPAGAAQPARPRLAAAAVVYSGRLRQRFPGYQTPHRLRRHAHRPHHRRELDGGLAPASGGLPGGATAGRTRVRRRPGAPDQLAVQRVLYRDSFAAGTGRAPGRHLLRQRLAGDRLLPGAGGERRAHSAGYAAGGLRRPEDFRAAHPAADQHPVALQRAGTAGGGVPVQSGRCRHARDAGGQAEGARLKPRLR